jgi:DNA helicase-2/ATP-dependent DNA helicase PcrA
MPWMPSPQQASFIEWVVDGKGHCVLIAVAGAGKTTTVIKASELMSGWVFIGAYNTKMAEELKERTKELAHVVAGTFHSQGFKALKFHFKDKTLKTDRNKVADMFDLMVAELNRPDLMEIKSAVCATVSMAKQRGIGALSPMNDYAAWKEMVEHFGTDESLPEDKVNCMEQLIKTSAALLKRSNANLDVIDFDDMIYLALLYNVRMLKHAWVIIDEAQDTNPTRRELAKRMLAPGGRLVAVGDPHQGIFGFTGADNDALDLIVEEFKAVTMPLSVTFRCPKAVVAVARQFVDHIEAADTAPEGKVESVKYDDLIGLVQPGDAILCRFNKYLVNLCFKLIRQGIAAKIEGRDVGQGFISLSKRWKVKNLSALASRLEAYKEREVKKYLDKRQEQMAEKVTDKVETLLVLIQRALEQGITTVGGLQLMIEGMFQDGVGKDKKLVTLCSEHKSKGLEWPRVFILGLYELQPSPWARQAWQMEQEVNLQYVAVTRAQEELYIVFGVKEEKNQREAA